MPPELTAFADDGFTAWAIPLSTPGPPVAPRSSPPGADPAALKRPVDKVHRRGGWPRKGDPQYRGVRGEEILREPTEMDKIADGEDSDSLKLSSRALLGRRLWCLASLTAYIYAALSIPVRATFFVDALVVDAGDAVLYGFMAADFTYDLVRR